MEALAKLDWANLKAGADVRAEAYRITEEYPPLQSLIKAGDELVEKLPGSKRLRKRRRLGIFRHLSGSLGAFPFFQPPVYPTKSAPEPRIKYLRDELEYYVIPGFYEHGIWRPLKDELTFDDVRALAMMKAGTLYRLTSKHLVPGLISRELGDSGSSTREVRFRTLELMRWGKVLNALRK
jgi:hypothetical protein